ncbi:microtubule-associated protein Jupiter-like [Uranotaenia lowii]|uniref:microtubule-associated protein Jupiter-like n=1 Tax=Uranotaenia lowii TaxID=190385 RepID=UPI0024793D25|nr:microtubule-associated protein Jupiter-like [Uranotaenia lowii]
MSDNLIELTVPDVEPETDRPKSSSGSSIKSEIFTEDAVKKGTTVQRRILPGHDSYNRLFGEYKRPPTPIRNHQKSTIFDSSEKSTPKVTPNHMKSTIFDVTVQDSVKHEDSQRRTFPTHNSHDRLFGTKIDTPDGSNDQPPKQPSDAGMENEVACNGIGSTRNRIPPGGHSSGLW